MQIYTVKSGDTLSTIAREYGVPLQTLVRDNQLEFPDRLVVGQALVIAASSTTHTVKRGDALYRIANNYNTTVAAILQANPDIADPNRIYPNQVLRIPLAPRPAMPIIVNGYAYVNIDRYTLDMTLPYLTYISPFSYEVRRDGSLTPLNDTALIADAKRGNVASLMVITNYETANNGFSSSLAGTVLQNPAATENLINNVMRTIQQKGYSGLDVDFEYVRGQDKIAYNNFLQSMADRLHAEGYTLSTAVVAKYRANQQGVLFDGVDYAAHGRIADHVLVMTYNWGYPSGPPMAVSPLNEVEKVIQYAVTEIPSKKILLGMPNYGYDWLLPYPSGQNAKLIMNKDAVTLAVTHWSEIKFDATQQNPYFNYHDEQGREHAVWFDDARSFEAKLKLIKKYDLGGVGYWNINTLFLPGWLVMNAMYRIEKVL